MKSNVEAQNGMPWWAPQRKRMMMSAGIMMVVAAGAFALVNATNSHSREELLKRGEYLVTIGGCNDCHTPWKVGPSGPEPDMTRMLSGHPSTIKVPPVPATVDFWAISVAPTFTAWSGPWGITYTKNLTPDTLTGLGIWTEEMFVQAIRTGRHYGVSRPIMPPMPWQNYRHLTDDDFKAVFAYLQSIPPVFNEVPDYQPPAEVARVE